MEIDPAGSPQPLPEPPFEPAATLTLAVDRNATGSRWRARVLGATGEDLWASKVQRSRGLAMLHGQQALDRELARAVKARKAARTEAPDA